MPQAISPARKWPALAALLALLVALAAPGRAPAQGGQVAPERGLRATLVATPVGQAVRIVSPERFALTVDSAGIVAWESFAAAPGRNLVPRGARLVEHRGPDGAGFAGVPRLVAVSPVRAVVRLTGAAGPLPADLTYTVWAGGQVSIAGLAAANLGAELRLDAETASGAALALDGDRATLYLDAWTPDQPVREGAALASAAALAADGAIVATWDGGDQLALTPPAGMLRQPRLRVAGWPGPELSLTLGGTPLVPGADYLADWDAATGELTLQYLGLLTAGPDTARGFTLGLAQAPALSIEILSQDGSTPRSLSPDGLLRVDANLPSQSPPAPGVLTTSDIFDIPYIQTWGDLRLRATVANPPAGFTGVRFVVTGPGFSRTLDDTSPADGLTAQVALPRRAEYRVVASALVEGQPAEPSKSIARVAYGRVFATVGDSITAGKWGFYRRPGEAGHPFTAPPAPGAGVPVSADGRNYPQSDNAADDLIGGSAAAENTAYQGYQVQLNDALAQCLNAPVFLLNSGSSGVRTARDRYKPGGSEGRGTAGYVNLLGKAAAIRGQIRQLGAGQVLLQVGTNDASTVVANQFNDPMPGSVYNQDLRDLIAAIRQGDDGLSIWVARLPWRNDGSGDQPALRRATTVEFNAEVASVVGALGVGAPVYLGPDFYAHFEANPGQIITFDPTDTTPPIAADNIHPTAEGLTAMAGLWAQAICQRIPAEPPPDGSPTPEPSPTPDPRTLKLYLPLTRR